MTDLFVVVCSVVGVAAHLYYESGGCDEVRALGKVTAALGFLVVALLNNILSTDAGRYVFVGLLFGAVGDVLMLDRSNNK